jgi:selenocysteine lyase/cysteine desulfurase
MPDAVSSNTENFPVFALSHFFLQKSHMIYLNAAGLSPFNQAVQQEVAATLEEFSRLLYSDEGIHHYRQTLQRCRHNLAQFLQVEDAQRIAFVPNATTASSLVLSRIHWQSGDHVLTTTHENSTVLKEILALQPHGVQIHTLEPSSPAEFEREIEQRLETKRVRAILISHVSHIDGRIFPIERLYQLTQKYPTLLIIDGAQAVGHIPVDFHDWQPDAYFFPGHKWCAGPMGTGALILRNQFTECDERKEPRQPAWADYELGTQNIGLIAGFAKACLIKQKDGLNTARLEQIREKVRQELSKISRIRIIEWDGPHSPGILSLTSRRKETNDQFQSKSHDIAWKTFQWPNNHGQIGIRLSWSSATSQSDIDSLLTFFRTMT